MGATPYYQNDASDTRFVACPGKAEGRNEAERPPTTLPPPAAQTGCAAHGPPPPLPHPPTREHPGSADPPYGERTAPSQVGGKAGPGRPPPKQAKRSTGPRQDTRRGTDRVERPYQRPAPGPREVRAPHEPGEGGGDADAAGARAHTYTKDTRGIREGQSDRARGTPRPHGMAYQRARVRDTRMGRPATHSAGHAGREGGNEGDTTPGTGPSPPNRPRAPRTHGRGTAPAKAVVVAHQNSMRAAPRMTRASPVTPTMLPTRGGQREVSGLKGPPGERSTGHSSPPPGQAGRTRCTLTERARWGGMRQRREGGQGREPRAAPQRGSGGAAAQPPPPPQPPRWPARRGGAGPHTPEAEGMIPPPPGGTAAPVRGAGARPAPRPSRRLPQDPR